MNALKKLSYLLVVPNLLATPPDGNVGEWNGSSIVAIGPNWGITATHTGGGIGSYLAFKGQQYQVLEVIPQPNTDLQLVRFQAMNGRAPNSIWHPIRATAAYGDFVYMGGFGMTATPGTAWTTPRAERWGTNIQEGAGFVLVMTFSLLSSPTLTPNEAMGAINDSGGGVFKRESDGKLGLEGIMASVSAAQWGYTNYGDVTYAHSSAVFLDWAYQNIHHGADANRDGNISGSDVSKYLSDWKKFGDGAENIRLKDLFIYMDAWTKAVDEIR